MRPRVRMVPIRERLATRRCAACGDRYPRGLPNCPTCKTKKGHDGLPHGSGWAVGSGFGG